VDVKENIALNAICASKSFLIVALWKNLHQGLLLNLGKSKTD
jgi:hypothetical protein